MYHLIHPLHRIQTTRRSLLRLAIALARHEGFTLDGAKLPIRHDLLRPLLDWDSVGGLVGNLLLEFLLKSRSVSGNPPG